MKKHGSAELGAHMTPARYDLLVAISRLPPGTRRTTLATYLGVCRQVIDRIIQRLEELGWVTCEPLNGRRVIVHITAHAASLVSEANSILSSDQFTTYRRHFWLLLKNPRRISLYFKALKSFARSVGNAAIAFSNLDAQDLVHSPSMQHAANVAATPGIEGNFVRALRVRDRRGRLSRNGNGCERKGTAGNGFAGRIR